MATLDSRRGEEPSRKKSGGPRIACLSIPLFPLAARLRSEPDLLAEPLVIVQGNATKARVVAASRRARGAGIRPGFTLPQARTMLPNLLVRPRDPECERAAREALLEIAESFTPRVEEEDPGRIFLDASGSEHRFPGPEPEETMARQLMDTADRSHLPARVGVAASKLAARVAADLSPSPRIVPPGEEASFLAPLPWSRLDPELAIAETLQRWGISSIGELARLPADDVASRLGGAGQQLHARARGIDPRPLVARVTHPSFHEGMTLEWPLVALEPFLFVARAAIERLCRRLESHGLACGRLEYSLRLEPDGFHERSFTLPAPTRESKTLLTLVRLDLEKEPPGAPVVGLLFTAHPDRPRQGQLTLFGPTEIPPDRLATTLARLFALLGPEGVGAPAPSDGHRPERCALVELAPPPPPKIRPAAPVSRGLMAVRVLRPALPVDVETVPGPGDDRPVTVSAGSGGRIEIEGTVRVASGPWYLEEAWWRQEPTERVYWDVELSSGGLYRIYRDRRRERWFADGVYD